LFQNSGGTIIDNCLVEKIVPFGDRTKIFLDSSRVLTSKAVVVCAGPWTNRLLEPLGYIQFPFRILKEFRGHLLLEKKTIDFFLRIPIKKSIWQFISI
jgi:glycine/D-amino acid oxidase-like deaminating enzyme